MVKWDDPVKRDHGEIHDDLAMIVRDVTARGLPEPTSSGNRQVTIKGPERRDFPETVYVGKHIADHPPGLPWYVQWQERSMKGRPGRIYRFRFARPSQVMWWLEMSGF